MKVNQTNTQLQMPKGPVIRSRGVQKQIISQNISTPRNIKFVGQPRQVSSNQHINQIRPMIVTKRQISDNQTQFVNNQIQKEGSKVAQNPSHQTSSTVANYKENELKQSHGLMSQLTFANKGTNPKIVSKHLLGAIDSQDYSMMTNQNEVSNNEDLQNNLSNVQLEKNMEKFKNNLIQEKIEKQAQRKESQQNLNKTPKDNKNNFEPKQEVMQSNLIQMNQKVGEHSNSLQDRQRLRSTSNSTRFTKKMMASNLLQSEEKMSREMQGNVIIYKTTDFMNTKPTPANISRSNTKLPVKVPQEKGFTQSEIEQYNFEYSYQDPVYQVYTENHEKGVNASNYVTPHFSSFQVPVMNSMVFKPQVSPMGNQSMQMSQMSQQNLMRESEVTSMNTYVTQNNMGFVDPETFQRQAQMNTIYQEGRFNRDSEMHYAHQMDEDDLANPVMYKQAWSKNKLRNRMNKLKGAAKFRPHSNNVRNIQYSGGGTTNLWGMKKNFQRKYAKKSNMNQNSNLSKKEGGLIVRKQIKKQKYSAKIKFE